jgi:hypothetical protein
MTGSAKVEYVATAKGFFRGARVRAGQKFLAEPGLKSKWFVLSKEFKAPPPTGKDAPIALSQVGKGAAKTFVDAMAALPRRAVAASSAKLDD